MKTSNSNRPPLVCRLVRLQRAMIEKTRPGLAPHSRHIESCPACQQFYRGAVELELMLRRDAARWTEPVPEGFEQRMARVLESATQQVPLRRSRPWLLPFSLVGVAAGVAGAFLFFSPPLAESERGKLATVTPSVGTVATESLPLRLWSTLRPSAEKWVEQTSLEREIDSVYSDARSAVAFLAMNFLPLSSEEGQGPERNRERVDLPQRG